MKDKDELTKQLTTWTMYVIFFVVAMPAVALVAALSYRLFCVISGI